MEQKGKPMSETLARRVGRLVSGGFHALVDAADQKDPEE